MDRNMEEVKNAPPPEPLEGKSMDELKEIINGLEKEKAELNKKLNMYTVMIQATIVKLKESGLDIQVVGRNMEQIMSGNVPFRIGQQS